MNDKEYGTGDYCDYGDYEEKDILVHTDYTLFPNGLDENGLATTDKQVSLHLTATDRAHDIIFGGFLSGHESYRSVKADSSNVSHSVLIGSVVTDSDVTEEAVASCAQVVSCAHGMRISSSNEEFEGEEEDDKSFNNASIEDKCVKMHLQKTACIFTSSEEENRVILKGGQKFKSNRSHRSDCVCLTEEEAEMRLDDKIGVTGNFANLIVTGLTVTTGERRRHLTNRYASQDSDCLLMEENVMEHDLRNKSACASCVRPYIHDKLLSCLALNVCGMLSKMKYPDFVSFISNYDIVAISESKLYDTDSVEVPGCVALHKSRGKVRRKSGG